jgi:hypothetical protein
MNVYECLIFLVEEQLTWTQVSLFRRGILCRYYCERTKHALKCCPNCGNGARPGNQTLGL